MNDVQFFQSNQRTRIYLDAIADVIGSHGLMALLRLAGLSKWIDHPPAYDETLGVDFADFAQLNTTLEMMYGPRGGRALALRAGRASFNEAIEQLGSKMGLAGAALKALPANMRVKALLEALAKGTEQHSQSQVTVRKDGDRYLYRISPCPACWGRSDVDHVMCHSTVGFLLQALNWAGVGDEFQVEECTCAAMHTAEDATCEFVVFRAS